MQRTNIVAAHIVAEHMPHNPDVMCSNPTGRCAFSLPIQILRNVSLNRLHGRAMITYFRKKIDAQVAAWGETCAEWYFLKA